MTIRVLIADDHKIMLAGLRSLLEKQTDFDVVAEAENGRKAVQLAQEKQPDVVVMDIVMPSLVDLGLSAALDTLTVLGFDKNMIHIQREEAPELLPETVIDQHPDAGL